MKAVVIGEPSGASMEAILTVYPRHKAVLDKFVAARMWSTPRAAPLTCPEATLWNPRQVIGVVLRGRPSG